MRPPKFGPRQWWAAAILPLLLVAMPGAAREDVDAGVIGDFGVTIAVEDVPPELSNGASLVGRWQITFDDDGAYTRGRQDVGQLAAGSFTVSGNQLTLAAETGVLACPASGDGSPALYEWERDGDRLRLVAIEEPCATRRLLLTTRLLETFVACPARPANAATPITGTPHASEVEIPTDPEPEIATLLKQMSSCWATRDPDRFLPLLSERYAAAQMDDGEQDRRRLVLSMATPVVWDQLSDLEEVAAGRVSASARQVSGDYIDFLRYDFIFENGAWRLDGLSEQREATPAA